MYIAGLGINFGNLFSLLKRLEKMVQHAGPVYHHPVGFLREVRLLGAQVQGKGIDAAVAKCLHF